MSIEVLETKTSYILIKNKEALWFDRRNGSFELKTCWDLASAENPICLGLIHALLGKLQILPDLPVYIVVVTGIREVGKIANPTAKESPKSVFCINKVAFIPLTTLPENDLSLPPCHKHQAQIGSSGDRKNLLQFSDFQSKVRFSKTFGTIRNVTSSIKSATVNAAASATGQQSKAKKDVRDKERYERRILDELHKMFFETNSFYFCNNSDADITSSLLKQTSPSYDTNQPLWKRADERFFWNKHLLEEFLNYEPCLSSEWLIPVIQGYVQIEPLLLDTGHQSNDDSVGNTLVLISRRSRFRAGTRYKRRGVDEDGKVANYVETEQIVGFSHHQVAFLQVRGSVPVFWSQPGYKYRPPPRLDKDEEEIAIAFERHFLMEISLYDRINCISLVEQAGKEKIIADTYLDHILKLNSEKIAFISFDFHEYCRGMRYENVTILTEGLDDLVHQMSYCWVDKEGVICRQKGVFRINCIDCLDRTNVVQTALAKCVLEKQFAKLGIIPPRSALPATCRSLLQSMWANNGDAISKQYAGTSALKGDFTRTGERNFAGLMKDGMNSANRYYLNRFKDAYRQATIDTMLGNPLPPGLVSMNPDLGGEEEEASVAQHVKHVIDDCKKMLVPDAQTILGAWGLIDALPQNSDPDQGDMDIILVLTKDSCYVAQYDDEADRIEHFERVSLIDIEKIEIGPYTFQSIFKQSRTHYCIRFFYRVLNEKGFIHMFRSMNIRFFNNMAVNIKTQEEIFESIKAIGDTFEVASQMIGCDIPVLQLFKLEKRKGRGRGVLSNPLNFLTTPISGIAKTSPDSIKNAGNRAFSNMKLGLDMLNPMSNSWLKRSSNNGSHGMTSQFYLQQPIIPIYNNGSSEKDTFLDSCGILLLNSTQSQQISSQLSISESNRTLSDGALSKHLKSSLNKIKAPEILVCGESELKNSITSAQNQLGTQLSTHIRKLSHSSDEVDPLREVGHTAIHRTLSATELDLHLTSPEKGAPPEEAPNGQQTLNIFSPSGILSYSPLSPLSPLSNFNKESVMAPFSVLARGVQSLTPNAGKLAKGVQNIGTVFDPRKLRAQRMKQLDDEDIVMKERKLNSKSRIIQF